MFGYVIWAWLQAFFGYVKVWLQTATEDDSHDSGWLWAAPAMEEEPVTVSLGPTGPLFQQLRSVIAALQGNIRRLKLKGVKAQIQILGQELEWLCIDLKDLLEAPEDAITRCWVRQVRDLCYDTADYLDELMHFIHCSSGTRRRLFGGNRRFGSKTFRISRGLTWLCLPKVKKLKRAPLIAKLSALVARVEDADERRQRFKLSPRAPEARQHVSHLMPQIPLQPHVDNLIKLLGLNDNDNEMGKKLKVVTIFGSAGVGKTAVARTLYHQYGRKFQYRAFLRVSRDSDMRRLLTDMLSQIKAPPVHAFSDVQGLIGSITKHLQGKRYLIIIDDLWSTSTWDIIIRALPGGDYCRIITTTQVEDVALACCSYQLKHISKGGCTTYPSSEGMKEAINLVYNNLPPHLKPCLLYLNMYPEGYTIRKDELVKQWVAESFIGSVQGQETEDTARFYFDALVSSGLVQSVDTNHNGEVLSCTLHHMVLDLIRQKSMEENFVTIVNYFQAILGLPDKVRRLSVQSGGAKGANNIPENMRISQVRSLIFCGFFKHVPSIVDYGLLQVLILHIWSDQDSIFDLTTVGELYRLRYLKIECSITVKLPGKIRRLRHLGTLQVDARLCAVPSDIVHLEKLLYLCLPSECILPHGVGRMTSLRTLGYFDLGRNTESNVRDLGELKNLQDLQLTCSTVQPAESLEKNMQLLGSVLHKLSILRSVTLVPATGSNVNTLQDDAGASSMSISCDGFSSVSPAPAHLQRLELSRRCCIFSRLPKWLWELAQLCILKIAVRELPKEDIDILKGLPALTVLSLHVATTSAERIVFGMGGFSVLTYLKFTCTLPWLKFEAGAMPNLRKLRLGFNAKKVVKQGIIIKHLSSRLEEISAKIGCPGGVGAGSARQKAITNDPRNPKVQWMGSMIYYGDEGRGHMVTQEAQVYCRTRDKGVASNNAPNDIANMIRSHIRTDSDRKVFGREDLRDNIMARFRETPQGDAPSSSTSPCYSVIGIYGVPGSGKTTFARYVQDYIKECKEKLFDTIMCIHVSKTFSVDDIFHEMLKDITDDSRSNISDRRDLKKKLKESLHGKRFFLILDDLWVKTKNDPQLKELIPLLNVGMKGSKILVTARTKVAARALCDDEPIEMPDLDEDLYFSMFMHYALGGTSVADEEFIPVGRVIAKKLHRSPIAAVTVAGRLATNKNIRFWNNYAYNDILNDTMDALSWSYQRLHPNIRRCLEYCSIFPRRSKLRRFELVCLWIAQGFVKTCCGDMENVAEGYVQELVSCSFLQPEGTSSDTDCFTIHDLLHDLLDKVTGNCFRIENARSQREDWEGDIPRDVQHLFVQNYDGELITEKILGLKNLRTLIIYVVERDTPVEEKVIESICKRLTNLRVLSVAFSQEYGPIKQPKKFLVPESISQLKHLRYLAFRTSYSCTVILPSTLTKLHHIQLLDFGNGQISKFTLDGLINLRYIICKNEECPNIGRLISLQALPWNTFTLRNEQGYEIEQLRSLDKLRGSLVIYGLENVKSKEEALEANLAFKGRLKELKICWNSDSTRCSPKIEAEVLEGLCPPVGLETLIISGYDGLWYPHWMVGKQNSGPNDLQKLVLCDWSQPGPAPELEAFPHLRQLRLAWCSWDALPVNMEHLTSLKKLDIFCCVNIRSLPTLPRSLEKFYLAYCDDEFMKNCQTAGHPNWQKIEHIPNKRFEDPAPSEEEEEEEEESDDSDGTASYD